MSGQDFQGTPDAGSPKAAEDAPSAISSFAQDAAGKLKQAASDTAGTLTAEVKELLNRKLSGSAVTLRHVGRST